MKNVIIFDFEVFKYDTLLGCIIINKEGKQLFQTWNIDEIVRFYNSHVNDLWIGHNNQFYDNIILQGIVNGKDPYKESQLIIKDNVRKRLTIPLFFYDMMCCDTYSLKVSEAAAGKNISETEVDFDLDRELTKKEKLLTESYNRDDLMQTLENFNSKTLRGKFEARTELISSFNLPLSYLCATEAKLGALVLGSKKIDDIEDWKTPVMDLSTLRLENKDLWEFYNTQGYRNNKKKVIHIGNADITIASGGAHSAIPQYHTDKALYCDVSGYYNLIMINYDLLPRTLGEEGVKNYIDLYHKQLEYKKTNPKKRASLKIVLLAVYGGEKNKFTDFYDPRKGELVTMIGELYICDLLEKLKDKVRIIQTNTDGIIIEPFNWDEKDEIIKIIEAWEERTGFVIKKDMIYNIWQRDVNCYFYTDSKGKLEVRGEAVKNYGFSEDIFETRPFESKEPCIIATCIVDYFIKNRLPEDTVEEYKNNLRMFQYICKKMSYDYLQYEVINDDHQVEKTKIQNVNRVFSWKEKSKSGMVYKYKNKGLSKAKVANLPENVFVYNDEILSEDSIKKVQSMIDYNTYIRRSYERINEFLGLPEVKNIA